MMKFSIFLVLLLLEYAKAVINFSPQVVTPNGILQGELGKTAGGRNFYKFWCVPYGKAERFERAELADPWEGVYNATDCDIRCVQFAFVEEMNMLNPLEGQEDCLVLNVFVPKLGPKAPLLPVMVWIHGGYFAMGSSLEYTGEMFLDENIVLVTINYRLGALGFLASGDGVLEANLGLKDQQLVLQWVQKNIESFGGDPNLVTIFGESAGAGSVAYQVLSPLNKGLFKHAIAQSGNSIAPWAIQPNPRKTFQELAAAVNCSRPTTQESKDCLKQINYDVIRDECAKTKWFIELLYPMYPAPEYEPPVRPGSTVFLPEHPLKMLKDGNFNYVPFIIGVNEDEGAIQGGFTVNDDEYLDDLNYRWIPIGANAVGKEIRNITKANLHKGLRKLRRFYFGDEDIGPKHLQNMTDMYSDAWFVSGLHQTIKEHSRHAPIYPYVFIKKGTLGGAALLGHFDRKVVSHGDELLYLFFGGIMGAISDSDKEFGKRFLKLWVSFAYAGKPIATWGRDKEWPAIKPGGEDIKYFIIDDVALVLDNPYKDRMELWDSLLHNEWNDHEAGAQDFSAELAKQDDDDDEDEE